MGSEERGPEERIPIDAPPGDAPIGASIAARLPARLQADIGHQFADSGLLIRAVTHSSYAHEQKLAEDNEQLEFLGDAVLGFLASDLLYAAQPGFSEGQLSRLKGFFVSSANLVKYAEQLHLGDYLLLGKGEEKTGGRTKQALLVDAFEAVIGAVYLDGGLDPVRRLVARFFEPQIAEIGQTGGAHTDFKTALQEILQRRPNVAVQYVLANETGPEHQKLFTIDLEIDGRVVARGIGLTKKAAEQSAAKQALQKFDREGQEYGEYGIDDPTLDPSLIQEVDRARVL